MTTVCCLSHWANHFAEHINHTVYWIYIRQLLVATIVQAAKVQCVLVDEVNWLECQASIDRCLSTVAANSGVTLCVACIPSLAHTLTLTHTSSSRSIESIMDSCLAEALSLTATAVFFHQWLTLWLLSLHRQCFEQRHKWRSNLASSHLWKYVYQLPFIS